MTRIVPILLAVLAACGGLGNPDLTTGEVRGRIVGGTPGIGYVYPVGRPDLKAPLAVDGSFRVRAPVGSPELVLFDGKPVPVAAPYGRAGRLSVEVRAAEISDVGERDGAQLPVASAVLAGVRAESGAGCKDPRFQAALRMLAGPAATDQDKVVTSGVPAAFLSPLPPGPYELTVSMAGFRTSVQRIDLGEAQTASVELTLVVDDGRDDKGCEVTSCESSQLVCCHDGDQCEHAGWCYDAGASQTCGSACVSNGTSQCGAGLSCTDGKCVPPGGAAACPAYLSTVGAACLSDATCAAQQTGLDCNGRSEDHAGVCTARCDVDADCAAFPDGWRCDGDHRVCEPHDD